jgi:N-(2-amino-2-carboxyethyl)-L-glutamate synthase
LTSVIYQHVHEIILDDVFLHLDGATAQHDVYLKLEGLNPAGSIKLKAAVSMVEDAERRGVLRPGATIIESSSGSLGIALAMMLADKGYRFVCVTDPNISPLSRDVMAALGAEVVEVDWRDAAGGYLGSRLSYIQQRIDEDPDLVWLNQYANPAHWRAHHERTARAITAELPKVDYLFIGIGTSGTLTGCVNHFREASPDTTIIAVDTLGSVSFGQLPGPRYIPGVGASKRPEMFRPELVDEMVVVPEPEAVRTCRWLARRYGLFAGGSTGTVVSAILRRARDLPEGSCVVGISPDFGDRYARTIYDDAWVTEVFGPECLAEPIEPAGSPELSVAGS